MARHKKTISGDVGEELIYAMPSDTWGAQITNVLFDSEPTGGTYNLEWSPNGTDWILFSNGNAVEAGKVDNFQASGYIHSIKATPIDIVGPTTWLVSLRGHNEGAAGPNSFLMTSPNNRRLSRIPVDSQQTSFEANQQFRFFCSISDLYGSHIPALSSNEQLVFKITATNAFNVLARTPEWYSGGRFYRVFGATGNETFTGVETDCTQWLRPVNSNLSDSGLDSHPISGTSITYSVGSGIFTTTDNPVNGTAVLSDSQGNNSSSAYGPNDIRSGVAQSSVFYLVFDHIDGGNDDTKGTFTLVLEERF